MNMHNFYIRTENDVPAAAVVTRPVVFVDYTDMQIQLLELASRKHYSGLPRHAKCHSSTKTGSTPICVKNYLFFLFYPDE
jgi:hypothetical protein